MQQHGGTPAADAIESSERRWYVELIVDWNRDGNFDHYLSDLSEYADNISVDRSLAGSAPPEIMLIEGASAAELTFDLGGHDIDNDNLNFVATFSPYNGLSPLYNLDPVGCEVIYRVGIDTTTGIVWYPQFVGNIRTITPNRATNTVSVTALDRVEKLRNPVQFPPWAIGNFSSLRGYNLAQLADSQAIIDHCLRFGETSCTPSRPVYNDEFVRNPAQNSDLGVRFWLNGTGAPFPQVGFNAGDLSQGFPKSEDTGAPMYYQNGLPHPDSPNPEIQPMSLSSLGPDNTGWTSSGTNSAPYLVYWGLDRNNDAAFTSHYIGFTLNNTGTNGKWWRTVGNVTTVFQVHIGYHLKLMVTIANGAIRGEVRNYDTSAGVVTSWRGLSDLDHHKIDIKFATGTTSPGVNGRFDLIINEGTTWSETIPDFSSHINGSFDPYTSYITVEHKVGLTDVYWGTRGSQTPIVLDVDLVHEVVRRPSAYAAVLDRGLNKLTHLPVTSADDAWDIITEVASAELGSVFWDESGVFRFWNRNTIVDKQDTTWRTFSLDNVQGLQITNSFDSVRNIITSESTRGFSISEVAFDSSSVDEFYIPGGATVKFIRYVDNVQSIGLNKVPRYQTDFEAGPYPLWDNDGSYEGYVVQWFTGGAWSEDNGRTSGVDVWVYGNEDGSFTIEIHNGYGDPARLATGGPTDSGSAALRVVGSVVHTDETAILTALDRDSIAIYGRRNMPLTGDWIQWQPDVVTSLLEYVLPRTIKPIPTTDAITVAGDPRLQLGDRVDIVDPQGMGELIGVQIYGTHRTYTKDTGLMDTHTVEMLAPPRIGIWDSAQYGLWDETFIWSA